MNKGKLSLQVLSVVAMILIGCDPGHSESLPANTGGEQSAPGQKPTLDFQTVRNEVLEPHCLSCHGGNGRLLSLATYPDVLNVIGAVQNAVSTGMMPPRSILPDAEKKLLLDWIEAGAPEVVAELF